MRHASWFLLLTLIGGSALGAEVEVISRPGDDKSTLETAAQVFPHPRQLHYQQLETIAFIHFGMNTFTGREWGDGSDDPALFNSTKLDANQWVSVLKQAGFKLLIFTAKHHDGFCLWPSDYTDYDIAASPWKEGKGDLLREVVDACNAQGMEIGLYLSPWDRHHPDFGSETYNEYYRNQLREILTNYGPFREVWFDGAGRTEPGPSGEVHQFDDEGFWRIIRELAPEAVLVGMGPDARWVGNEDGYARDSEWSVLPLTRDSVDSSLPPEELLLRHFEPKNRMDEDLGSLSALKGATALHWYPAEADVSIRPGWFYHPEEDSQIKSVAKLTDIYFGSVGRNAVLLLNIPPNKAGRITQADADTLLAWRQHLDEMFETNLVKDAAIRVGLEEVDPMILIDGNISTSIQAVNTLTFSFDTPVTLTNLLLQEAIEQGQHVAEWVLEAEAVGGWTEVVRGTTIGYKRLERFDAVTTSSLRLRVLKSRGAAWIGEVGFYTN
ncbi:alpha-L-fucosidase [bacterium]|nr:alpha-L-fucosidase [bacterium]